MSLCSRPGGDAVEEETKNAADVAGVVGACVHVFSCLCDVWSGKRVIVDTSYLRRWVLYRQEKQSRKEQQAIGSAQ